MNKQSDFDEEKYYLIRVVQLLQKKARLYHSLYNDSRNAWKGVSNEDYINWVHEQEFASNFNEASNSYDKLANEPYFAKMSCYTTSIPGKYRKDNIYIGKEAIVDSGIEYVIDWRNPIAKFYYIKNINHFIVPTKNRGAYYDGTNIGLVNVHYFLLLKRTFDISKGKLNGYNDIYKCSEKQEEELINNLSLDSFLSSQTINNLDVDTKAIQSNISSSRSESVSEEIINRELLRQELLRKRDEKKVTDIIKTIQTNQYNIMTKKINESIVLQGCAGSGKTMILLHRLAYLLYNYENMNPDQIVIIVPNLSFGYFIKELAENLGLTKVPRIDLFNYYIQLLKKYNFPLEKESYSNIIELDDVSYKHIYSYSVMRDVCDMVYNYVDQIKEKIFFNWITRLDSRFNKYQELFDKKQRIGQNLMGLYKDFESIYNDDYDYSELKTIFSTLNIEMMPDFQSTFTFIDALEEYCNHLVNDYFSSFKLLKQKRLELKDEYKIYIDWNEMQKRIDQQALEDSIKSFNNLNILQKLIHQREFKKSIKEQKRQIEIKENKYNEYIQAKKALLVEHNNRIGLFNENNKSIGQFINVYYSIESLKKNEQFATDLFKKLHNYKETNYNKDLLQKLIKLALEQENAASINYFVETKLNKYIQDLCVFGRLDSHKIKNYKWYYYILLLACYYFYGQLSNCAKYIFIDEGQDISSSEYLLLRDIHGYNVVFNIYGDINQSITNYGINTWNDISFVDTKNIYYLNENYRNSFEINQFCNYYFDNYYLTLGPSGDEVKYCSMQDVFQLIASYKKLKKKLIIVLSRLNNNHFKELKKLDIVHASYDELVSYYFVDEIKGLEFKNILVFTDYMNKNEKYISFTRALEKLFICGCDDDKAKIDYVNSHQAVLFEKNEIQFRKKYDEIMNNSV